MELTKRVYWQAGSLVLAAILIAACGSTPTPAPTQAPQASVAATDSPTPEPVATATPEITLAPTVGPSVAPSESPSESPIATLAPTSPPASGGSVCSGKANFKSFFTDAANALKFDVYCAVLPSDWWGQDANYTAKNGGMYLVTYQNPRGHALVIIGGYLCPMLMTGSCMDKPPVPGYVKKVWFADTGAYLFTVHAITAAAVPAIPAPPTIYLAWVPWDRHHAYLVQGIGMGEAGFIKDLKAFVKVPKS